MTLAHVLRRDTISTEEGVARENFLCSLPLDLGKVVLFFVGLLRATPSEGFIVGSEDVVREVTIASVEGVEVDNLGLVPIRSGLAGGYGDACSLGKDLRVG